MTPHPNMRPIPFLQLFRYATREDLILLGIANLFILYSSFNIPLVNIVYGLMMREMNDFVARRAHFIGQGSTSTPASSHQPATPASSYANSSALPASSFVVPLNFNGTFLDAQEQFINNSYHLCMIVIIFGVTRFIALYLALFFFSRAAANQAKRVRVLFFKSLLRQEVAWFEQNRTGDFAIRITSDLSKFEEGIGEKIALCLNALFAWMSSLISSFYYGWELTLVCLVLVPLTIFITTVIAEFQATYSIRESSALSSAFNVCHEVISSIRTVLSFSGQQKEAHRFREGLDSAYKHGLKRNMFAGLNSGFTWMSGYLGFAICLLYSTKFYKPEYYGHYDEAHIITILWSAAGCVFLLNRMMPFIEIIQMARGSASNLFAVIERKSLIDVTSDAGLKPDFFEANVVFDQVCFTYPSNQSQTVHRAPSHSAQPQAASVQEDKMADCGEPDYEAAGLQPVDSLKGVRHSTGMAIRESSREEQTTTSSSTASTTLSVTSSTTTSTTEPTAETSTNSTLISTSEGAGDEAGDEAGACAGVGVASGAACGGPLDVEDSRATLRNMCLEVKCGQTIALVGPSGSGKSTALALLQRFYELGAGKITLGGYNVDELNLSWLRGQFGVVTQEPVLFDMSIADNIRLGARPDQEVCEQDVERAARNANAHAFIVRLPAGYATRAGARGVQLSGGQKQRIAIARALIRQPKILLLDEATSALDLESESVVQKALDQARIGRTTFVVAHRLSTVRNADKIVVFDRGTIVETGSHDELIQQRGLYYQIHAQQKAGFDLMPQARRNSQVGGAGGPGADAAAGAHGASATHGQPGHATGLLVTSHLSIGQNHNHNHNHNHHHHHHHQHHHQHHQHHTHLAHHHHQNTHHNHHHHDHYTRESRSLSIYSGKYTAGAAFGAAGHGGNGEGVDNGGSCAASEQPTGAEGKFTDEDLYERPDGDECDDTTDSSGHQHQPGASGCVPAPTRSGGADTLAPAALVAAAAVAAAGPGRGRCPTMAHDETQASMLDADSTLGVVNHKGKREANLSMLAVLRFIKPDLAYSLAGIVTSLLMGLCIPISAIIIGNIATIFATDDPAEIRAGLFTHGLMYTGLALFAFCVSFVQVLSFGIAGEKIGINLRQRGFGAIMAHELAWFDHKRNNPGSICARLASDVGNVQTITGNRTAVIFQSVSILLSTFIFAIHFNLKFSSICALFVAILLISTVMQARYAGKLAVTNRSFDSQIGKIILESSANIRTLVSLHQEDYFIERCETLLNKDNRSRSLDNHLRLSLESLKYAMTAISKGSSFYFAAGMLLRDEITIDVVFKLIEIILYGLTEASKSLIFISDLEKARRGTQNLYKLIYHANQRGPGYEGGGSGSGGGGGEPALSGPAARSRRPYLPRVLVSRLGANNRAQYKRLLDATSETSTASQLCVGSHHKSLPTSTLSDWSQQQQQQMNASKKDACCHLALAIDGAGASGGEDDDEPRLRCEGSVTFKSVCFNYPSRPDASVLKSLSVEFPAGKSIALVGRSGCGKSTIVQLLEKFYNYAAGDICIDGRELKQLSAEWVRKQIALVSQEPALLSYTIGDNIRYGDTSRAVTFEEIVAAARVANIHDFIMSLPEQYDTQLSESNSLQLSGGQKQRIAIARALVRRAPILVFDEATSALDTKSEHHVQEALDRARHGKTCIIIAHRLSTIKKADRIVVLRDGMVVEQGTHQELVNKRGEYYCLYKTQSKL